MAFANPNITAYAVEATEFPDLARRYRVNGVPKTVVNDEVEILGALPQDEFIEQALQLREALVTRARASRGGRCLAGRALHRLQRGRTRPVSIQLP